jgi:energy-converting hydrogenase Eha subunit A
VSRAVIAEFTHEHGFEQAVKAIQAQEGFQLVDTFTPYRPHDNAEAGRRVRVLIRWSIITGLIAAAIIYVIQLLSLTLSYPFNSGGRPQHSWQTFLLAAFEGGVLAAAATGFVNFLRLGRLPHLADAVFEVPDFERASQDRYFLALGPVEGASELLMRLGALRTAEVEL